MIRHQAITDAQKTVVLSIVFENLKRAQAMLLFNKPVAAFENRGGHKVTALGERAIKMAAKQTRYSLQLKRGTRSACRRDHKRARSPEQALSISITVHPPYKISSSSSRHAGSTIHKNSKSSGPRPVIR